MSLSMRSLLPLTRKSTPCSWASALNSAPRASYSVARGRRRGRGDAAAFQARDVQQVGDQVLRRAQRAVEVAHQLAGFNRQRVLLVGEGGGEQPGGVQRLHQVVADGGEETRLRLVRRLGGALGFDQRLVELGQFEGAVDDALLQAFVGFLEGLLGFAERGDVGEAHDEAAAGHGVADQLDDPAVGEQPLGGVGVALAHPEQPARDVGLGIARPAQAAFGVVADDVGDGPADADQAFGIVEQLQVAAVPGDQAQ